MKGKVLALLLAGAMMLSLVACGGSGGQAEESEAKEQTQAEETENPLADDLETADDGKGTNEGTAVEASDVAPITPKEPVLVDVYADDSVQIQFYKYEKESNRDYMDFRVKNLTDRTLTFQSDCISINGESINRVMMSDSVSPNSNGTIRLRLSKYDAEFFDFANISKISGDFSIIDFSDDEFYNGKQSYKVTYSDVKIPCDGIPQSSDNNGNELYADENVSVSYLDAVPSDEYVYVKLRVSNFTNEVITIQPSSMGINGESASRASGSEAIAPLSTGNIEIKCSMDTSFIDFTDVLAVTGTLSVITFNNDEFFDGRQSYKITF